MKRKHNNREPIVSCSPTPIGNTPNNLEWVNSPEAEKVVAESKMKVKKKNPVQNAIILDGGTMGISRSSQEADRLLMDVYQLALTDGDAVPVLMRISSYLTKNKLI